MERLNSYITRRVLLIAVMPILLVLWFCESVVWKIMKNSRRIYKHAWSDFKRVIGETWRQPSAE